jgi:hypothetical protein
VNQIFEKWNNSTKRNILLREEKNEALFG